MKRNQLSRIMKTAWSLVKKNGFSLSEGLKQSWQLFKLKARMASGVVEFSYRKVDGSIRRALGTLSIQRLPATKSQYEASVEVSTTLCYFDVEKDGWRQFRIANLLW